MTEEKLKEVSAKFKFYSIVRGIGSKRNNRITSTIEDINGLAVVLDQSMADIVVLYNSYTDEYAETVEEFKEDLYPLINRKDPRGEDIERTILANVILKDFRIGGNTTRIIDNAVQLLFGGYVILLDDYDPYARNECVSPYDILRLKKRIKDRVKNEHPNFNFRIDTGRKLALELDKSKSVINIK